MSPKGAVMKARFAIGSLGLLLLLGACGAEDDAGDDADAAVDEDKPFDGPLVPPLALGEPIEAPDKEWTWIDFPETRCMNDTATGLAVRFNEDSDKVIIVVQGGGACFNTSTCVIVVNSGGFGEKNIGPGTVDIGLIDPEDPDNPFKDWNMVFVPYCSGDIFSGNAPNGTGYNGRTQTGYKNFQEYLKRLVPTFKDASHVVLSGYSAGAFAASINWVQARETWGTDKRVDVLNDSGPTMGPEYLTPCMQERLAETWHWADGTIPESCTDCDPETGNVTAPATEWTIANTKMGRHGLISSTEDSIIKRFFGYGHDDCSAFDGLGVTLQTGVYAQGLKDLQDTFKDHPGAAAYIIKSTSHVWTMQSPGAVMSEGVVLRDWIEEFLDPDAELRDVVPAE
jgi:hypothetical protein